MRNRKIWPPDTKNIVFMQACLWTIDQLINRHSRFTFRFINIWSRWIGVALCSCQVLKSLFRALIKLDQPCRIQNHFKHITVKRWPTFNWRIFYHNVLHCVTVKNPMNRDSAGLKAHHLPTKTPSLFLSLYVCRIFKYHVCIE